MRNRLHHPIVDVLRAAFSRDRHDALGFAAGEFVIGASNLLLEGRALILEAIGTCGGGNCPAMCKLRVEAKIERQVGAEATGCNRIEARDKLGTESTSNPLIGEGRIGEAITDNSDPRLQRRPNLAAQKVGPGSTEKQELGERLKRRGGIG